MVHLVSGIPALTPKLFFVLLLGLAIVFSGCSSSQPAATPTPEPTAASTAMPEPSASATSPSTPTPTAAPTLSAEEQLDGLKVDVGVALAETLETPISFTSERDPNSGSVTYYAVGSKGTYDFQVMVAKAIALKWPADVTLVRKTGESGTRTKTIAFVQSKVGLDKAKTEAQLECNNFHQMITLTMTEIINPTLPFGDFGAKATLKLIDVCS